jgi:hypothetical protein
MPAIGWKSKEYTNFGIISFFSVIGALFKILHFLKNISRYNSAWEHNNLLDLEKDYEIRINDIDLYESIGGTHLASSYAQINHY